MSSGSSGQTNTDANDVWRRAAWSNGEIRTRRCTPASASQQAVGVVAGHGERRALDARLVAGLQVDHVALEAAALGPAQVHAQQHLGPVLRLGAAGARVDGHDGVLASRARRRASSSISPACDLAWSASRPRRSPRRPTRPARPTPRARPGRRRGAASDALSSWSCCSRRRRCSTCCAAAWSFQKSGDAACASRRGQLRRQVRTVKDSSAGRRSVSRDPGSGGSDLRARMMTWNLRRSAELQRGSSNIAGDRPTAASARRA